MTITLVRKAAFTSAAAASALLMGASVAHAATVGPPGSGVEQSPPFFSANYVCGKVTTEPGNQAVSGATVTATLNTSPPKVASTTTNSSGGWCIHGDGYMTEVTLNGRSVALSVSPSSIGTLTPNYPNGGAPLDLAWFQAHQSGLNATGANIEYR